MSKIPYLPEVSMSRNLQRLREHMQMTNAELAKPIGVSGQTFQAYASRGFKTQGGNFTNLSENIKAYTESLFKNGIPKEAYEKKEVDLYTLMHCNECEHRTRSHHGCLKFGLSKEEINRGAFITTLNHGAYALHTSKPCPYAKSNA